MRYKVVFSGTIAKGHTREEVKKNISEIFKLDAASIDKLFSGKSRIIKNNADHQTASKIQSAMEEAGAICKILKIEEESHETLHDIDTGSLGSKITEETKINCPKCGFQQIKSESCPQCGVIFRKITENAKVDRKETDRGAESAENSALKKSSPNENRDWLPIAVFGVIATIFLIASYYMFTRFSSVSSEYKTALKGFVKKVESTKQPAKKLKKESNKLEGSRAESVNKKRVKAQEESPALSPFKNNNDRDINDLIAFFPFNGNAHDESGNGNHGTVSGAILAEDRFGNKDRAYSFDGKDDFIDIGLPLVSGDFTISFWLKSNGRQNQFAVPISQGCMAYRGFNFTFTKGLYNGFTWGTWRRKINPDSPWGKSAWYTLDFHFQKDINTDFAWHHLATTQAGDTIKIFRDGKNQGKVSNFPINYGSFDFNIGRASGNRDFKHRSFNGLIDDVRIYNRALTEEEIQALYKEGG